MTGRSLAVDLADRVALITGGGHGLGATLARRFAASGASVFLIGRAAEPLIETARSIQRNGGRAAWKAADVSIEAEVHEACSQATAALGTVNILINNAGIAGPTLDLVDMPLADWSEVLAINLTGVFLCCKAVIPIMRAAGGGKIINIGSGSGKRPLPGRTPYTASKLGLVGLTRTLAHEVGPYKINVNLISPFLVAGPRLETVIDRQAAARGVDPGTIRSELTNLSPFKRGVTEDDVANLALFLCSSASDNMTGQDINVSAGAIMF